jgi:tetratricopeptide (TPR) repeat protein
MSDVRKYFVYGLVAIVMSSGLVGLVMADDDDDDRSSSGRIKLKKDEVMISYVQSPTQGLPPGLDAIAFIPFSQAVEDKEKIYSPGEKRWGDEVIAAIAQKMQQNANQFKIPLKLVERESLAAIMKEKDLADAGLAQEDKALQLGKLAKVQAICYGRVAISIRTVEGQAKTLQFAPSPDGHGMTIDSAPARRLKRTIAVSATVKLVAVATGKSILVYNNRLTETKDLKPHLLMGSDAQEIEFQPEEEIINQLVSQIVDEFVGQLVPNEIHFVAKMGKPKSKLAKSAAKFIKAGDFAKALELSREAVEIKPDDHGAWYNLGLSYEATGDLVKALDAYGRASRIKD